MKVRATWPAVVAFIAAYGMLQWLYAQMLGHATGLAWIDQVTVRPAAWALGLLLPADGVVAAGLRLVWSQGSLGLRAGCDGFEVITLFAAAAVIAPLQWSHRMLLLLLGCSVLWAFNQTRIWALYAAFRHQRDWFDAIHTLWGPLWLVLVGALLYALALRFLRPAR